MHRARLSNDPKDWAREISTTRMQKAYTKHVSDLVDEKGNM